MPFPAIYREIEIGWPGRRSVSADDRECWQPHRSAARDRLSGCDSLWTHPNVTDVHLLVAEHLMKGKIVPGLLAMMHEPIPEIAWLNKRKGAFPPKNASCWSEPGLWTPKAWKIIYCMMAISL